MYRRRPLIAVGLLGMNGFVLLVVGWRLSYFVEVSVALACFVLLFCAHFTCPNWKLEFTSRFQVETTDGRVLVSSDVFSDSSGRRAIFWRQSTKISSLIPMSSRIQKKQSKIQRQSKSKLMFPKSGKFPLGVCTNIHVGTSNKRAGNFH